MLARQPVRVCGVTTKWYNADMTVTEAAASCSARHSPAVPGKPGCQPHHLHTQQKETVHVLNGTLGYYKGHHTHAAKLEAGGTVSFEPGVCGEGRRG